MRSHVDPLSLVPAARPVPQRPLVSGVVSSRQPAPAAWTDPVFVICPDYSPDRPLGPCKWGAIHGASMPVQGCEVLVAFGHLGEPRVVWWDGPHT